MTCLVDIAVDEFKAQFFRDFPYLPTWLVSVTYNTGDKVYYEVNNKFYTCINDGVTSLPTVAVDWTAYEDDAEDYVQDGDIDKAFIEGKLSFNESLVYSEGDCSIIKHVFYYLTAHYLVMDLRTAQAGISSTGEHLISSKSAGNVSVNYVIPDAYINNPMLNFYTKTSYGLKYLNIIHPAMVGNFGVVTGATTA